MVVAAVLGSLATFVLAPLPGDIRYEIGVKAVSVSSASETFSHRPLAYRLLMDRVASVADALSFGLTSFEVMVRLIGLGMAAGAAVLLWRGLRSRGVAAPGLHAVVAGAAIVLMGTRSSIEAEWIAVLLAMAGVGAALVGHNRLRWPMAFLAGVLFVAAAAMKVVTLPTALVGLLVVGVLDRRQLLRSLLGCAVVGVLFVIGTVIWVPWETTWLFDLRMLQPPVLESLQEDAAAFWLASAARWPAVGLLPAALILADRTERLVLVAAVLLAISQVVLQGQYFVYHAAALCVVAAVAVFRALRWRVTTTTGIGVLVIVVAAAALTATSTDWRMSSRSIWGAAAIAVVVLAIGWALAVRSRRPTRRPLGLTVAALTTLALLYPATTPFAARLMWLSETGIPTFAQDIRASSRHEIVGRQIRRRIGADTPVTYLMFGHWTYFVRNPTYCRYPSPLFLQRTKFTTAHLRTQSYAENLACIDEPKSQWLLLDRRWFKISKAPPELQARVAAAWNCSAAFNIGGVTICPRRS